MKLESKMGRARTRNTGDSDTRSEAMIDHLAFTMRMHLVSRDQIMRLLGKQAAWTPCQSMYGYASAVKLGNVILCWGGNANTLFVEISGKGCREVEAAHRIVDWTGWANLIEEILDLGARCCRVDFAFDDRQGLVTYSRLLRKAKSKCVLTSFRKVRNTEEFTVSDMARTGASLTFGGTQSDYCVKAYDKSLEADGCTTNAEKMPWTRIEVQARGERAGKLVEHFIEGGYRPILGDLRQRLSFRVRNSSDSNKSRWKECEWWVKFLQCVPKQAIHLNSNASFEESRFGALLKQYGPFLGELQQTDEGTEILASIFEMSRESYIARIERLRRPETRRLISTQGHRELRARAFQQAHMDDPLPRLSR